MDLRLFEFAEYASVNGEGSLTIAGVFDGAKVMRPPGTEGMIMFPKCYLVFVLTCGLHEGTQHRVSLLLEDADGQQLAEPIEIGIDFKANAAGRPMKFQGIAQMPGLPVPDLGEYVVHLAVDGERLGSVPLYLDAA